MRCSILLYLLLVVPSTLVASFSPARPSLRLRTSTSSTGDAGQLTPPRLGTETSALMDPYMVESTTTILSEGIGSSVDSIKTAFSVATFLPQPFWLFLILLPNAGITKKIMGGMEVVTLLCLVHFFIVATSIGEPAGTAPIAEFNDVFDPSGNPQAAMINMMRYPNFVSEEWSHVLTWDLFVGRWIWLDGIKRGVFTPHSVLLCNLIGPPGLLLHWATCIVTGKGLPPNTVPEEKE